MLGSYTLCTLGSEREGALLAVDLAQVLSKNGRRVLILELSDVPSADLLLGLSEQVVYTVSDVACGRVSWERALLSPTVGRGKRSRTADTILLLPTEPFPTLDGGSVALKNTVSAVGADVTLVVSDASHLALAREISDVSLLLCPCEERIRRATEAFLSERPHLQPDGLVLTGLPSSAEELCEGDGPITLSERLHLPLFGVYPQEKRLRLQAARNMAERMTGNTTPLLRGIPIEGISHRAYFEYL